MFKRPTLWKLSKWLLNKNWEYRDVEINLYRWICDWLDENFKILDVHWRKLVTNYKSYAKLVSSQGFGQKSYNYFIID